MDTKTTSLALPMPALPIPSMGSIDAYIQAVNRIPMLSDSEELQLAKRYREHQDIEAAGRLVLSHLRYVVAISRQYMGYGLSRADLIQEGNIGLMQAVKRFEPERGFRLVSYASHWIKALIQEYILRNWSMVKVATTKAQRKLFFSKASLFNDQEETNVQHVARIAKELGVKTQEVVDMQERLTGGVVPIESSGDEDTMSPATWLTKESDQPEKVLAHREHDWLQSEGLQQALATLDARSKSIIEQRWLSDEGTTLHQLGAQFGVSHERISQIEKAALKKLRLQLAKFNPNSAAA